TDLSRSGRTLHQAVTMASLVEEESRHEDERPVVAGILWKREEAGTILGVDATVRYIVGKPSAALTVTDLDTASPYNTRKVAGLPPGPIANPGVSAIVAALQPQASEYWYYLHGTDGMIHYARTNDEHNANKARYLR
ncbi:MAG TPA: endolytic transglycosylase MltG, partial [Candidatus Peribacteria bacterium]|nr:endolytic transglycosylase MltG [Candidatus Peribacteria bacterium]